MAKHTKLIWSGSYLYLGTIDGEVVGSVFGVDSYNANVRFTAGGVDRCAALRGATAGAMIEDAARRGIDIQQVR